MQWNFKTFWSVFGAFCIWLNVECLLLLQIAVLLSYYRQLAQREKLDKEKKRFSRRRSYLHLSVSCM